MSTVIELALEGPAHAHIQVIQALGLLAQTFARMPQASGQAIQAQALARQPVTHAHQQAALQAFDSALQVAGVGGQQFGGGRRRWRADISDEIADGYIGFMTDGADNRRHAGIHGAGDRFFVETPEVFQRAAAAGQDQGVETLGIGDLQRADDLRGGFAALDRRGNQGQFDLRSAPTEHADDVADHRAGGRTDDPDPLRMRRQRHLAFGAEQAFGAELFLQRLEGQAQGAITGRLDRVENQLIVATAFEQRDLAAHLDRQAILQGLAYASGVLPEQRAANLGAAVLEGEIDMAGGRAGEVGDFAFDPDIAEHVLQQHPRAAVELADSKNLAVEAQA